jgi:high frequency lysogenization protein
LNTSQHPFEDIVIALAGIAQASSLVSDIANSGQCHNYYFEACLKSIVIDDPLQTIDVFGDLNHLKLGLETIRRHFSASKVNPDIGRYLVNLTMIQKQLQKDPALFSELSNRLDNAKRQLDYNEVSSPQMLETFADIYTSTISKLPLRIQVSGKQELLEPKYNQNKVRAILLAGVRAAVLWRQVGGKRRQILFQRKKLLAACQSLLERVKSTS